MFTILPVLVKQVTCVLYLPITQDTGIDDMGFPFVESGCPLNNTKNLFNVMVCSFA